MNQARYWLAFGDIHDDISRLEEIPELPTAHGVIITGDMTVAGGRPQAQKVLAKVEGLVPNVLAQIGNMDHAEITDYLEEKGWNLHIKAREIFPDIYAIGVGGSPFTPFGTPSEFSETRLLEWLERGLSQVHKAESQKYGAFTGKSSIVLVSHAPPHASACDRLHSGTPAGSTAVRDFIEKHQPDICLCGHIHESCAEDLIGRTHVLNPGMLGNGGYVKLSLHDGTANNPKAELRFLA